MQKSSPVNKILLLFVIFIMWALLAFNTNTVDRMNYEMFYNYSQQNVRYPGIEIGFYYFMHICAKIGLSFQSFLIVYSSIGTFLITKSVIQYVRNGSSIILILFIFFPYLHIIAALRNYMAFAIIIWGIQYLTIKANKNLIKYLICVIIASSFHVIALCYLIFIMCFLNLKRIKTLSFFFAILGFLLLLSSSTFIPFLIRIIPKLQVYLTLGLNGTRSSTKLFLCIYFISKVVFCLYCDDENDSRECDSLISVLRKIQFLSLMFFPVCIFDMDFMRLEYNIFVLMSIYVYSYIRGKIEEDGFRKEFRLLTIAFVYYYIIAGYILLYLFSYESIVKTIWQNNLLFQIFLGD